MTHRLEVTDESAELFALVAIGNGVVDGSLSDADHLGGDTDPALIEDLYSDLAGAQRSASGRGRKAQSRTTHLIPLADFSDNTVSRKPDVVESQLASRGRLDTELRA